MLSVVINILRNSSVEVEGWMTARWKGLTPHIYLSCDIRHSGGKISVVDTNLYPAGFNNLCKSFSCETSAAFAKYLGEINLPTHHILIYPEAHTRNKFYLQNLLHLSDLLRNTGREVDIGLDADFVGDGLTIDLESANICFHKISRENDFITCEGKRPDLLLLNNDLSSGMPDILKNLSQPILPDARMGWYRRRKHNHFRILESLLRDFAGHFDFDPWLLTPYTDHAEEMDLGDPKRMATLSTKVEQMLGRIAGKYREYGISEAPYVYLKNNTGTYGMGLLPLSSGEELLSLSRRQKNKLLSGKQNLKTGGFLIMEGIPTSDFYSGYPIEPVIYVVGRNDVGGFFRIHESKNELESLNAPGMSFSCLCLHKLDEPHEEYFLECESKRDVVVLSRFLARMASLAASLENQG